MHVPQVNFPFPLDLVHVQRGLLAFHFDSLHLFLVKRKRKIDSRQMILLDLSIRIGYRLMFGHALTIQVGWWQVFFLLYPEFLPQAVYAVEFFPGEKVDFLEEVFFAVNAPAVN